MLKKILFTLLGLSVLLAGVYVLGPKPVPPSAHNQAIMVTDSLPLLEFQINESEKLTKGLKKGNEARIVWADSSQKIQTEHAILYIHGFSASREEGDPVVANLAKKFKANLFQMRLPEHGLDLGDSTMENFTAQNAIYSVETALLTAKRLGKNVHIIGTSFGGALALYLGSKHSEIKTLSLYSPCIKVFDPTAELLDDPWGLKIAQTVKKGLFNDITPKNADQPKFWTMHYRLEALVELQNFLSAFMNQATFEQVKCPVFVGYYYEDEENQDKVVSVKAIQEMYETLGSKEKVIKNFKGAKNHVLASWVLSEDIKSVESETENYLKKYLSQP